MPSNLPIFRCGVVSFLSRASLPCWRVFGSPLHTRRFSSVFGPTRIPFPPSCPGNLRNQSAICSPICRCRKSRILPHVLDKLISQIVKFLHPLISAAQSTKLTVPSSFLISVFCFSTVISYSSNSSCRPVIFDFILRHCWSLLSSSSWSRSCAVRDFFFSASTAASPAASASYFHEGKKGRYFVKWGSRRRKEEEK